MTETQDSLAALADVIPESFSKIRDAHERWINLSPEEQAAEQAQWDAEDLRARELELERWRNWKAEGVPARYAAAAIAHAEAQAWVEQVCEDRHCNGLLIAGPTGVGKTYLLWGIYHELAERQGPRMEVVKLVRLLSALRPGGEANEDTIAKLCSVPVLAIDDIGAHNTSPWVEERLYEIIDTRYDAMLPIVATTNRKALEKSLGEQVISRLEECCKTLVLTGPDRRRG